MDESKLIDKISEVYHSGFSDVLGRAYALAGVYERDGKNSDKKAFDYFREIMLALPRNLSGYELTIEVSEAVKGGLARSMIDSGSALVRQGSYEKNSWYDLAALNFNRVVAGRHLKGYMGLGQKVYSSLIDIKKDDSLEDRIVNRLSENVLK